MVIGENIVGACNSRNDPAGGGEADVNAGVMVFEPGNLQREHPGLVFGDFVGRSAEFNQQDRWLSGRRHRGDGERGGVVRADLYRMVLIPIGRIHQFQNQCLFRFTHLACCQLNIKRGVGLRSPDSDGVREGRRNNIRSIRRAASMHNDLKGDAGCAGFVNGEGDGVALSAGIGGACELNRGDRGVLGNGGGECGVSGTDNIIGRIRQGESDGLIGLSLAVCLNNQTKAVPAGQLPFIRCPRAGGLLQAVASQLVVLRRVSRTVRGEIDAVKFACGGGWGNTEIDGESRAAVRIRRLLNGILREIKINRRHIGIQNGDGGPTLRAEFYCMARVLTGRAA